MSESEKKKQKHTEGTQEPVLTRYDLKVQRRQEQKKREEREKKVASVAGILILAGLICFMASFPIRSWLTVHGTYLVVGGEKVPRVEFDYYYYTALNNYQSSNGYLLSMMGVDLSGDLSAQMYSDTLTWKDFFDELAVDNIKSGIAVKRDMEAAGFTYDETEEYEGFVESLKQSAQEHGHSVKESLSEMYGPYATLGRLEDDIRDSLKISAYLDFVAENNAPSDEDIQAYYEENSEGYDNVDYHMLTVEAELPTEPTELADPVEETDEEGSDDAEEAYQPSQAEIDAAMLAAKDEAERKLDTVASEGDAHTNEALSGVNYTISQWLSDSGRKKGDTTVIENTTAHCYYVLSFDGRYVDPSLSVDVRFLATQDGNGQEILDEWTAGEATEDSFAALADKYNDISLTDVEGGLLEGLDPGLVEQEISDWLTDSARKNGDTSVITPSGGDVTYVFYYIGAGEPVWKTKIRDILINEVKTDYVASLVGDMTVEDPHHNLRYLEIRAQEEAAAAAEESGGGSGESADGEDSGSDESTVGEDGGSGEGTADEGTASGENTPEDSSAE